MKTTYIGKEAEIKVAKYLKNIGFKVLGHNWRTRLCEIDLIAQKDNVIYFIEVKFRGNSEQGEGLEYITPKKLKQIHFAAEIWVQQNNWDGDYQILAASVDSESNIKIFELN
jgi:Holliday junction resolvase-like predicted endonuclease